MKKNILVVVLVVLITALSALFYEISQKAKSPEPNIEKLETATENNIGANNKTQIEENTEAEKDEQRID